MELKRRSFLKKISTGLLGTGIISQADASPIARIPKIQSMYTIDKNKIHYFSDTISEPIKVILASDTHLWMDDERGLPYRQYSNRMAKAYNNTTHFQTGEATNPEESFINTLKIANESRADLIALPGDLFSWPSEAAIEWAHQQIDAAGIPYIYVAGNHDWHYEGMEGDLNGLRSTWIQKRLLPLYQGKDPMMATYDVKGIRFVAIDNSTYEISADQLAFFRSQVEEKRPLVLLLHIPLYAPLKSMGFGCGHPDWGAATDKNYIIERRPQWPSSGHTADTMAFYKEVFNARNLLAVFAGHIHHPSLEQINGIPQFVADDNASGAYLDITFSPLAEKDRQLLSTK